MGRGWGGRNQVTGSTENQSTGPKGGEASQGLVPDLKRAEPARNTSINSLLFVCFAIIFPSWPFY